MNRESAKYVFVLLILSVFFTAPLLNSHFLVPHDNEYHIVRLIELDKSISDGEIYARWLPDLAYGYGYPLFNYYSPLIYYLAEIVHLSGFNFFNSLKAIYFLGTILGGLFMFLYAREIFGNNAGLVAGVAYIYVPYHIVDVYVRGALPEFFSFAFFPLLLWSFYRQFKTDDRRYMLIASLAYALLILTHNLMALMFTPVLISYYFLLTIIFEKRSVKPVLSLIGGLGISAFYWVPALAERGFIQHQNLIEIYKSHFVFASQLFSLKWGYGFSGPGIDDAMSFQIGLLYVYFALLSLYLFFKSKKQDKEFRMHTLFFLGLTAFSIFMMLGQSSFIWDTLPYLAYSGLPWRFLAFVALSTSFLSGAVSERVNNKTAIAVSLLFVLTSFGYLQTTFNADPGPNYSPEWIRMSGVTGTVANEFLPESVLKMPNRPASNLSSITNNGSIKTLEKRANFYKFTVNTQEDSEVKINTFWFPGWKAYVDGKETRLEGFGEKGIMRLMVPGGKHEITVRFESTPIRRAAAILSVAFVIFLLLLVVLAFKNQYINDDF